MDDLEDEFQVFSHTLILIFNLPVYYHREGFKALLGVFLGSAEAYPLMPRLLCYRDSLDR